MKFLKKLLGRVENVADDIGEGAVKLARAVGINPSDAQLDKLKGKGERIASKVAATVAEELGDMPGVPDWAATIVAQAALTAFNTIQAGLIEGAKAANVDK